MVIAKKQTVRGSGMQPLAEKAINDNFNNIFQKVGGNIEYMDFSDDVKAKWDSMVTDGNLQSKIEQNPEWIRISFNGNSDYIEFRNDNHMYFTQNDGSYFKIGLDGLKKHTTGGDKDVHYLSAVGSATVTTLQSVTIQLPDDFKGKQFSVALSSAEVSGSAANYAYLALARNVISSIDYTNARFTVDCYINSSDLTINGSTLERVFYWDGNATITYVAIA